MNRESFLFITLVFVCYSIGLYAYLSHRDKELSENHADIARQIWKVKNNG